MNDLCKLGSLDLDNVVHRDNHSMDVSLRSSNSVPCRVSGIAFFDPF